MENPAPKDAILASVQGPTGVVTGRGMCEEKRTDDRPAEGGTLNSGRLTAPVDEEIYLQRPNGFQPIEGVAKSRQDSDLPIVVRGGNTDHTAKDQAGMQRGQSTHARGRKTLDEGVSRTLSALGTKAGEEPEHRFRGLACLLDRQMLDEAFRRLKRKASPGIDGVTHAEYAENLEENLLALESRLKEGKYRAQPVKRRWIAKAGSMKMRPLGIPTVRAHCGYFQFRFGIRGNHPSVSPSQGATPSGPETTKLRGSGDRDFAPVTRRQFRGSSGVDGSATAFGRILAA